MKIVAKENPEFTIFRFGNSEIRVVDKQGDPWFVAKDFVMRYLSQIVGML